TGVITSVAFSADGRHVAAGSRYGTVQVWDALTGKERLSHKLGKRVFNVAFSADGKALLSASVDGGASPFGRGAAKPGGAFPTKDGPAVVGKGGGPKGPQGPGKKRESKDRPPGVGKGGGGKSYGGLGWGGAGALTVKGWDLASGQEKLAFKGHPDATSAAFS